MVQVRKDKKNIDTIYEHFNGSLHVSSVLILACFKEELRANKHKGTKYKLLYNRVSCLWILKSKTNPTLHSRSLTKIEMNRRVTWALSLGKKSKGHYGGEAHKGRYEALFMPIQVTGMSLMKNETCTTRDFQHRIIWNWGILWTLIRKNSYQE